MKLVETIEVDMKTLEEFGVVTYNEMTDMERKEPLIDKHISNLRLDKSSLDAQKIFNKYFMISGAIMVASITLPGFLLLLFNFNIPDKYITSGVLSALAFALWGIREVNKRQDVIILSYRLGELLQSRYEKTSWEPKQFKLLGDMIEENRLEIEKSDLRNYFKFHRSVLSETKLPKWLSTVFQYNTDKKTFERKEIEFKITDKIGSKLRRELENQLDKLFIVRCLVALK